MAGVQHLLRKAAIEKMASPEQLDMAMRVTSPWSWLALATLGTMVVAAVGASIIFEMSVKVDGDGILMRGDTVQTIQVSANGTVAQLLVDEGDTITEGQAVAKLDLPELEREIATTRDRVLQLQGQVSVEEQRVGSMVSSYKSQLNQLYTQKRQKQRLLEKRLATRGDVAAIDAQINSVKAQINQQETGLVRARTDLEEQNRRLRQQEQQLSDNSVVRSRASGRVAAILRPEGQIIKAGERLINLEDPDSPIHVLLFVPVAEGKKVKEGMRVRIAPSTVKPEEYGFILGEIVSVSTQPVTPQEVRSTLNNDRLAAKFEQDAPFRVRAEPLKDPNNPSGFQWTSAGGPPIVIDANTPCTAQIVVDKKRPISYVIPTVKKTLGMAS